MTAISPTSAETPPSLHLFVHLDANAVPALLVKIEDGAASHAIALSVEQAERFVATWMGALGRAKALLHLRSVNLPPEHAEVQSLLDVARIASAAHDAFADALDDGPEGSSDALASAREEAFDALSDRFAAFDGESVEDDDDDQDDGGVR